jgi:hypothetical protein
MVQSVVADAPSINTNSASKKSRADKGQGCPFQEIRLTRVQKIQRRTQKTFKGGVKHGEESNVPSLRREVHAEKEGKEEGKEA